MTRIIAGCAKGRRLLIPRTGTRPTSERVREALFSFLEHRGYLDGTLVADLYAGSGALGLEALSRGAAQAVCVESYAPAAKIIVRNARMVGLCEKTSVINKKVDAYLSALIKPAHFDLAMADPPYDLPDSALRTTLALLANHMASDGLIVVERASRSAEPSWPEGWILVDDRRMGDTRIWSAKRVEDRDSIDV